MLICNGFALFKSRSLWIHAPITLTTFAVSFLYTWTKCHKALMESPSDSEFVRELRRRAGFAQWQPSNQSRLDAVEQQSSHFPRDNLTSDYGYSSGSNHNNQFSLESGNSDFHNAEKSDSQQYASVTYEQLRERNRRTANKAQE